MSIQQSAFTGFAAMVLAACAAAPEATAQSEPPARTISVNGEGRVTAPPDMAVISIGVRTDGANAAAALRANSEAMSASIKKLKSLGVADRDIQTSGLSINPRYNYEKNRSNPEIIGYTAANTVTVRLRDLEKAGAVIDQTVQSGANSLGGISFTFSEPQPLYDAARRDAVLQAKARAQLLADAAGVKLGHLLTIQDGYVSTPGPRDMAVRMEMSAGADVPIAAGESAIKATVSHGL